MIIIYTTNWCAYCVATKKIFKEMKLKYKEVNIENENISREKMCELTGGYSIPQIIINNKCIGGYQDLIRLHQNNQLKELLNE